MIPLVSALLLFFTPSLDPISDVFILADPSTGKVEIRVELAHASGRSMEYEIEAAVRNDAGEVVGNSRTAVRLRSGRAVATLEIALPRFEAWSPERPALYAATVRLLDFRGLEVDHQDLFFGFRKLERRGSRLFLNSRPVFLRAFAGEFESGGDHGCMTSDRAYISKRISAAKAYGFNAERHHSHYPTEEYLELADKLGLMQQVEIHGRMREGPASPEFAETRKTWTDMVRAGRRHPSVVIYSMGNEVYANEPKLIAAMDELYDEARRLNPAVLVLNRSGSLPGNDGAGKFDLIERPIGEYEHSGRLAKAAFEAYLRGDRAGRAREFPVIAHEYPLVSAFPRLENAARYPKPPAWFVTAQENATRGGYLEQMPRFARNSEVIQWHLIKQMIEAARLFPELAGYSLLRLHDSAALVGGILDDFSNPKSLAEEVFRQVNGPAVLLADWPRETFRRGDAIKLTISIANNTNEPINGELKWSTAFESGKQSVRTDSFGVFRLTEISLLGPHISHPSKYTLHAQLGELKNSWDFWVFTPAENPRDQFSLYDPLQRLRGIVKLFPGARIVDSRPKKPGSLLVTDSWPDWMPGFLMSGGRLLLISDKNWREPEEMGNHGTHLAYFTSRAPAALPELDEPLTHWLTIPSNYQRRWGNSGTVVERHPALGEMPHEGFCDLQFFSLIRRAKSFWLDRWPERPQPIIRAIDNYWRGSNKAYLVEFRVGQGRVLATTLNFTQHLGRAPEADYLLEQFIRYTASEAFQPATAMTAEDLEKAAKQFQADLPELIKRMGDVNAPPDQYRYDPLSGAMN